MRIRSIVPLLLATIAAVPAAAQVQGRYQVVGINDRALPTPSPMEPNIVVTRGAFWFHADGGFRLALAAHADEERREEDVSGTYEVAGDSLRLTGEDGGDPVAYRWALKGDTLRLWDESETVYALVREPVQAGEAWAPGAWSAVRVNGQALPAPLPLFPDLTVTRLSFEFSADGHAIAHIRGTSRGEEVGEDDHATYRIDGERLIILDEEGGVDEEYAWTLRNGQLRLTDVRGHVYVLERM